MTTTKQGAGGYDLEGTLLAACSCPVPCPRWIGTDPNGGPCDAVHVYHLERGTIRGVDVSGLSAVLVVRSPGGQVVRFVDEQASDKQLAAILDAYRGKLGGPLGGPGLVADELAVERVEIVAEIRGGKAEARIGDVVTSRWPRCRPGPPRGRRYGTRCSRACPCRRRIWAAPTTTA